MATRSTDARRSYSSQVDPYIDELDIIASDTVYEGSAVGANTSGNMRPLVEGDSFRGFAEEQCANETGSAGDKKVRVRRQGLVQLSVTGVSSSADNGKPVYATDDDTFTLTPSSSRIGQVAKWISSTTCLVWFQADQIDTPRRKQVVTKSGNYTVVMPQDTGKTFIVTGTSTITLPASSAANIGCFCEVIVIADVTVTVATATAGELVTVNDAAANSVATSTVSEKIGASFELIQTTATTWFAVPRLWEAQTVAIAT